MRIQLFDARMLMPLVRFLNRHGVRSERLLNRARIPGELIEDGGWISKKQAYDFTLDVVRTSGCHEAVFSAYLEFGLHHLGPVANAMRSCRTVKEALEVGLRLGSVAYEGNEYSLMIDGDTAWMCYREPRVVSAGQAYIDDMTLTVYAQLIRALASETWRPERMLIRKDVNERHREVEGFEECRARVDPRFTALAFPAEFLSQRLPNQLQTTTTDTGSDWQFGPEDSEPNVERLYRLLASRSSCRKLPTLDQICGMVDVSQATLKRHLAASGLSYQGLLDRLRFDKACEMLSIPEVSVKETAAELGYADTSNFARSFRRIAGMPPEKYRQRYLL